MYLSSFMGLERLSQISRDEWVLPTVPSVLSLVGARIIHQTTGKITFANTKEMSSIVLDNRLKLLQQEVHSVATPEFPVVEYELIQNAKFSQIFTGDLNRLCLTQEQIINFICDRNNWINLQSGKNITLFLLKVNSDFFVVTAIASLNSAQELKLYDLSYDGTWCSYFFNRFIFPCHRRIL